MELNINAITTIFIVIALTVFFALAIYCLYKNFKKTKISNNSEFNSDFKEKDEKLENDQLNQEEDNSSNKKNILLIFGAGDKKINNGKNNHENLKNKINEIREDIEDFYKKHIFIKGEGEKQITSHPRDEENIISNFQKTKFEQEHDFIQYFFPSKSKSKFESNAPYVNNPSLIRELIKDGLISIEDIDKRFENFFLALKLYFGVTGIYYVFPNSDKPEDAIFQEAISDKVSSKIKDELINRLNIQHNQLRITRVIESIDLHLQFLKFAKEVFNSKEDLKSLEKLQEIKSNFDGEINEYIVEIFEYILELSKSENKKSSEYQTEVFLDLLINIDEDFKNKKNALNDVEKFLLGNINNIRKKFKNDLFDRLSEKIKNQISDKMNQFISQIIEIDPLNIIIQKNLE